jgi:hypothetical protein
MTVREVAQALFTALRPFAKTSITAIIKSGASGPRWRWQ